MKENVFQQNCFGCIWRHKLLSIISVTTIIGFFFVVTLFSTRWYQSQAALYFRLGRENAALDATATVGESQVLIKPSSREREINTIMEILQSRGVAEALIAEIGHENILLDAKGQANSDQNDQSWLEMLGVNTELSSSEKAVIHFTKNLEVKPANEANLIWISYEARTAEFAHDVVQKLIQVYLRKHVEFHRTAGSHAFLAEQTGKVRTRLEQAEEDLRRVKYESLVIAPEEQEQALVNQAARIQMDLILCAAEESSLMERVQELEGLVKEMPTTQIVSKTTGLSNEAADRMRDQLYALQIREQELLAKFSKTHPAAATVRDQIQQAQSILDAEKEFRTSTVEGISKVREQGDISLLEFQPLLKATARKSEMLRESLAQTQTSLRELNDRKIEIKRLQREVELAEIEYRKYSTGLDQARLDEALELERISNVSVAQQPTLVHKPVRPIWLLNMALGLIVALIITWLLTGWMDGKTSEKPLKSLSKSKVPQQIAYPNLAPTSTT